MTDTTTSEAPLLDVLRQRIAAEGPLSLAHYMETALVHPDHGYYTGKDPLGAKGDFTTAPEVSQMFGELIGLWCVVTWQQAMAGVAPLRLVELGPGRGTLMADAMRAARALPPFQQAAAIDLVEVSPALRDKQRLTLETQVPGLDVTWRDSFVDVPDGPLIVIANEFLDALPVRQFQRVAEGWSERLVGVADDGGLELVLSMPVPRVPLIDEALQESPVGSVVEVSAAVNAAAYAIGERIARFGGAALFIDYGHGDSAVGETLQAVRDHKYHPVLQDPGQADLTAHVDFQKVAEAAEDAGAKAWPLLYQGEFLDRLGLAARAEALLANADEAQAKDIQAAYGRLIDPDEMGTLFKVLVITHPEMPAPPGHA
ncbi:MAG: SAM-dependent methyltransferase [Rhodobacterales bacterium]|nr:SAM-dependent methyltransferase [Rhodobacterales bacterium]